MAYSTPLNSATPFKPPNSGVTGIGFLFKIIQHLVTMIGPHGDRNISSFLHQQYNLFDHFIHIYITIQMISFIKISFCIPLCIAKVKKMNVVAKPFYHFRQIIIWLSLQKSRCKNTNHWQVKELHVIIRWHLFPYLQFLASPIQEKEDHRDE